MKKIKKKIVWAIFVYKSNIKWKSRKMIKYKQLGECLPFWIADPSIKKIGYSNEILFWHIFLIWYYTCTSWRTWWRSFVKHFVKIENKLFFSLSPTFTSWWYQSKCKHFKLKKWAMKLTFQSNFSCATERGTHNIWLCITILSY